MPSSIAAAQKGYDFSIGESRDNFNLFQARTEFEKFGELFKKTIALNAEKAKVVDTGKLAGDCSFVISEDGSKMQIFMPDYFDYPNEGVRGVRNNKNAPNSPYKFKNYGMNAQGRASIKSYIERGKAKIKTVHKTKDKALGIGRESKHLPLIEVQTEQLIYMIKRYGIKATNYFNKTVNEVFGKEFEVKMTEAVGRDIVFTIEKITQ